MNTHERFIEAVMNAIPDPSPGLAAYIEDYQMNISKYRSNDETVRSAAIYQSTKFWNRLSTNEQRQLRNIQKGL